MSTSGHKAEVKFLTLAFWDIRGFSKLCDTLRASSIPETLANGTLRASRIPDTLVKFLTEYYDDVKSTVTRNEGVVVKFMGDGVMARQPSVTSDCSFCRWFGPLSDLQETVRYRLPLFHCAHKIPISFYAATITQSPHCV